MIFLRVYRQIAVGFQRRGVPLQGLHVDERDHGNINRVPAGEQRVRFIADRS